MNQGLITHVTITIGYDTPWRKVHELLIQAALETEYILTDPKPFVIQTSLNDFHVSYQINAYTREANRMAEIHSQLNTNIQEAFQRAGLEIMSPTYLAPRDGNTVTLPQENRSANYRAPSFRVASPS
ncbi:MAG: mechanosensitive ion channel [Bryobacterales bacterium]|nr:mechanosensitive ion channel [Bryobacterales bacterium]